MKIVCIFVDKLYSFHYENESNNELGKLLDSWNDASFLFSFYKQNETLICNNKFLKISNSSQFANKVIEDAKEIDEILDVLSNDGSLNEFFIPLSAEQPYNMQLSKNKGRKRLLRLYALKIDENCFVITGGAIKITKTMDEHNDTKKELAKIDKCRNYLKQNNVVDSGSFYEFLNELNNEE